MTAPSTNNLTSCVPLIVYNYDFISMTKERKSEIIQDKVLPLVKRFLKDHVERYIIEIENASKPGDSWLGLMYNIAIRDNQGDGKPILHLIAKMAPLPGPYRDLLSVREIYCREIFIYDEVIPHFFKLLEDKGLRNMFFPFAKKCVTSTESCGETIIMENMKEKGFKSYHHRFLTDYPHTQLIMKEMGRFHALSYALRDQNPKVYQQLEENCQESFFNTSMHDSAIEIITTLGKAVLDTYDPIQDQREFEALEKSLQNASSALKLLFSKEAYGKYSVINHGDPQIRNILFKYGDCVQTDLPTEFCLIDWQLSRVASPALDIQFFLCSSTDRALREGQYENLVQDYYQSLSSFLRQLGSDPDVLIPFEILQRDLKNCGAFALYLSIWVLALNMKERENIPDLYINRLTKEMIIKQFTEIPNEAYIHNIRNIVSDFVKYEYNF